MSPRRTTRPMRRRLSWLAGRRVRGLGRPAPLRVVVVNCMSVSTGPIRAQAILFAAWQSADVILASECADFDGAKVLGREWDVRHDTSSSASAGCLIAVRKTRGAILDGARLRHGSRAGFGIQSRRFWDAQITVDPATPQRWTARYVSGHAPPLRALPLWAGYMCRIIATRSDVAGADYNRLARRVQTFLHRRVDAVHVLGLATRWWIPTSAPRPLDVGGDHRAVLVTLWPEKETR